MTEGAGPYAPPRAAGRAGGEVTPPLGDAAPDPGGLVLVGAYLALWVVALVPLAVWTVLLLVGAAVVTKGAAGAMNALGQIAGGDEGVPTWALAATLAVQLPLMLGLVPAAHAVARWLWYRHRDPARARPEGWRGVFGAWGSPLVFFAIAAAMGLVVGAFPGWIADRLRDLLPSLAGGMIEQIDEALRTGHPVWRALFVLEIAVGAPLVEELVFRGFMWDAFRRVMPVAGAWVATSLVFAAYHMDPLQSVALVFTALALGWVRWMSGSVWPGVVLHAVNNGLGVFAAVALGGNVDSAPTALALGTATASVALGAWMARARARRGGALASDARLG